MESASKKKVPLRTPGTAGRTPATNRRTPATNGRTPVFRSKRNEIDQVSSAVYYTLNVSWNWDTVLKLTSAGFF